MLVNEINNYKALTTLKKQVEGLSNNYRIPTFYGGAVTANSCWLLLEYVPTTQSNAQEFTEHDYALARDYVAQIGRLPNAANMFRSLSFWGLLMGFLPGLVFVSLRSQVFLKHSVSIARDFLAVMGSLLSPEGKSLSHLDLKPENILESNGKKYLIDFQFLAFVHPMYELAFLWDRSFVIQQSSQHIANIVERLVKGLSPKELRLVRVLVTYGLLYDILVDHEQPLPVHERALEKLISL
jgi:serine/threonine protein kinase